MKARLFAGALALACVAGLATVPASSGVLIVTFDWQGITDVAVACSAIEAPDVASCIAAAVACLTAAPCPAALMCHVVQTPAAGPGWHPGVSLTPLGTATVGVPLVGAPERPPDAAVPSSLPGEQGLINPMTYQIVVNYHCILSSA